MMRMIKKILFRWRLFRASEWQLAELYAGEYGIRIGNRVRITGKVYFGSEPYLITIGDRVTIANGVSFLTHDGGVGLFRDEHPGMNVYGPITIGNDVFIGASAILLPGVRVGNRVVIGAGAVVTRDVPDNVVVAGVPAHVVRSIDDYKKRSMEKAIFITSADPEERKREILKHFKI